MPNMRTESDSMGKIEVAADRYWAAQPQRSLQNFKIGGDGFTRRAIRALGLVKKAVALVKLHLKTIPADVGALILRAADGPRPQRPPVDIERTSTSP